jgi:transcriptional regulator with XRE-family HTH domain
MAPKRTVDQIIGERIREERHAKKLTMDQLATKIGVRFNVIHKVEMGQCKMTVDRLIKIARTLGIAPDRLMRDL